MSGEYGCLHWDGHLCLQGLLTLTLADNLIPFTFHVFPMFCLMLWDSFVLQIRIFGISGFHVAPALPET